MPGIVQLRQSNPTGIDALPTSQDKEKPEESSLWMPSTMPSGLLLSGCVSGLLEKEARLRLAQAHDSLNKLRHQLRIMTYVFNYKKTHVSGSGQRANTRARTLMARVTDKTRLFADEYRAARQSLLKLDPSGEWQDQLRPLLAIDVRGPGRYDDDDSEGRRELSWIWLQTDRILESDQSESEYSESKYHQSALHYLLTLTTICY